MARNLKAIFLEQKGAFPLLQTKDVNLKIYLK